MKILPLAQPENVCHRTKFFPPQRVKEVKGVRNSQFKYGDFIVFLYSTRPPSQKVISILVHYILKPSLEMFGNRVFCIHRINSFSNYQSVFIHRMSDIDAHFIAFRVTVTLALHAFGESCCKCDMSQKCLWENR